MFSIQTLAAAALLALSFGSSAFAWNEPCQSSSGYCLRLTQKITPDQSSEIVTMIATPLSENFFSIQEDGAEVQVNRQTRKATLIKGESKIEIGSVAAKPAFDSDDYELTVNAGTEFSSSIQRVGFAYTCVRTALGIYERYKTPVVEIVTTATQGSEKITVSSVEEDSDLETRSYWWGLACTESSYEIRWK